MPQIVEVPGQGNVEFPDAMSDQDIGRIVRLHTPEPETKGSPEWASWRNQRVHDLNDQATNPHQPEDQGFFHGLWEAAKGMNPFQPGGPIKMAVQGGLAAGKEALKAQAAYKGEGEFANMTPDERNLSAVGHGLAAVTPFVGPLEARAGEKIGGGQPGEGIGNAVAGLGAVAGPALLGKVAKGAGSVIEKAAQPVADVLRASSERDYSRALNATTKGNKLRSADIVPELIDRGVMAPTLKGLGAKAKASVAQVGEAIGNAWEGLPEDASVKLQPVLDRLQQFSDENFTVPGKQTDIAGGTKPVPMGPVAQKGIANIQALRDTLKDAAGNDADGELAIPAQNLRRLRQYFDTVTEAAGRYEGRNLDDATQGAAHGAAADAIREELGKQYPDIAALNKEFSFWKDVDRVVSDTLLRRQGQAKPLSSTLAKGAATGAGYLNGGLHGAIVARGLVSGIERLTTSPAWRTVSAVMKDRLADAIAGGDQGKIADVVADISASQPKDPKSSPEGGGQPGNSGADSNASRVEQTQTDTAKLGAEDTVLPAAAGQPVAGKPVGFQTSKGSQYTITGGGTARNKVATGQQFSPSDQTVYASPDTANRVMEELQANNVGNLKASVRNVDGQIAVVVKNRDTGAVRNDLSKVVPTSQDPEVGMHPIELWHKNQTTGEYGFHIGHAITDIHAVPEATNVAATPKLWPKPALEHWEPGPPGGGQHWEPAPPQPQHWEPGSGGTPAPPVVRNDNWEPTPDHGWEPGPPAKPEVPGWEPHQPEPTTRLYRVDSPKAAAHGVPEWMHGDEKYEAIKGATGRWFAQDPSELPFYLKDSDPGATVTHVDVPTKDLEKYRVTNAAPEVKQFSARPDKEFFVPKDLAAQRTETHPDDLPPDVRAQYLPTDEKGNLVYPPGMQPKPPATPAGSANALHIEKLEKAAGAEVPAPPEVESEHGTPAGQPAPRPAESRPVPAPAAPRTNPVAQQAAERSPAATGTEGSATSIKIPGSNVSYPARYRLRELTELNPSHNGITFERNPKFPYENDRDYTQPVNQERVFSKATPANFDPEYMVNTDPTNGNGPPAVTTDGHVLGGNSRTMILQRVNAMNPVGAAKYRQYLIDNAQQFGIDPTQVADMKFPVLVRELDTRDSFNPQRAITDFNKDSAARLTPAEQATADARNLTPGIAKHLASAIENEGPDATLANVLNGSGGRTVVNKLIDEGVFSAQDKPKLIDSKTGAVTAEAKDRISKMFLGSIFRDSDQMYRTPPALRNKLERIVAPMLSVSEKADWNIAPVVKSAVDLLETAESHGIRNLDDAVNQQGLFANGTPEVSHETLSLAKTIKNLTPTELAKRFKRYAADSVPSMFGEVKPKEAFDQHFGGD